jgi:formyltetrahydrofolate hydrolase
MIRECSPDAPRSFIKSNCSSTRTRSAPPVRSRKRVASFVSRYEHCMLDLLWRWRRDELRMDIVAVVSNHPDLEAEVAAFGVPYHHIKGTPDTKAEGEQRQLDLLAGK